MKGDGPGGNLLGCPWKLYLVSEARSYASRSLILTTTPGVASTGTGTPRTPGWACRSHHQRSGARGRDQQSQAPRGVCKTQPARCTQHPQELTQGSLLSVHWGSAAHTQTGTRDPEDVVKMQILTWQVWGGDGGSAFLMSSQGMPMPPIYDHTASSRAWR